MILLDTQHWARIYDQSPVGISIVGIDGRFLKVNKTLCNIVEYTENELLSKTFQEITHPEDLQPDKDMLKRVESGDIDGYEMVKRYITKHGDSVWVFLTVAGIKGENDNIIHYVSHIRPISKYEKLQIQKSDNERNSNISIREFILDNWQWFIGAVVTIITVITTLSIMIYATQINLDNMKEKIKEIQESIIIEND